MCVCSGNIYLYIWVIPYQINKPTPWILMIFGTEMDPIKKLSCTKFWLILLMHDHSKVYSYMFNKLAITLSGIITELFCLECSLKSLSDDLYLIAIVQRKRSNHKYVTFSFDLIIFKNRSLNYCSNILLMPVFCDNKFEVETKSRS